DPPVLDVALDQLDVLAPSGEGEVVGQALVVVEEVPLDDVATVAEAEDELVVPKWRVLLHQVADERPVANVHHRLGDGFGVLPQPGAETTAEEHHLHATSP